MPVKSLRSLLQILQIPYVGEDYNLTHISLDSRSIKTGGLFLAVSGHALDGKNFIASAEANGAVAVLAEEKSTPQYKKIPIIYVENLRKKLGNIANYFYDHPGDALKIVGVTGTNGKTSCSHFLAEALQLLGNSCGIIGTLGNGLYGHVKYASLTTPDALALRELFANFSAQQCKYISMEVSSHSIHQDRINDINFAVGIFTNLSRDHLDYHGTIEAYAAVKKSWIKNAAVKQAVINADDAYGREIINELRATKTVIAYTLDEAYSNADIPIVRAKNIMSHSAGRKFSILSPWGNADIVLPLVGRFNISNVLAVFASLCLLGFSFESVISVLSKLHSVSGRMQKLGGNEQPLVIVDYSHTPDALENVLSELRMHTQGKGKLFCLFGCGGNRDRGKRPLMARIAEKYADVVVVTDDNTRHEKSQDIINDIMLGFNQPKNIQVISDRGIAIKHIISLATTGDCVLIAGKGGEDFQLIGDQKIPFNDVQIVHETLYHNGHI